MGRLLNYGLIEKKSKGYRKALRQCKKNKRLYGASFDNSETWYEVNLLKYKDNNKILDKFNKKRKMLIVQGTEDDVAPISDTYEFISSRC